MMRQQALPYIRTGFLAVIIVLAASGLPSLFHFVRATDAPSFTFTAAGDYGPITDDPSGCGPVYPTDTCGRAVAKKIASINPDFDLALGDLGYTQSPTNWCSNFGSIYSKVALITGNHDTKGPAQNPPGPDALTGEEVDGWLDTSTGYVSKCSSIIPSGINWVGSGTTSGGNRCLTDPKLTSPSCYAREYYFDYPASNPIMRFIIVSAGIAGPWVDYTAHSCPDTPLSHYCWLSARIDDAKNAGLWVAVGLHKQCVSDGSTTNPSGIPDCESTFDPFSLGLAKKVDLWLDGHSHTYQRSYQLSSCTVSNGQVNSCNIIDSGDGGTLATAYVRNVGTVVNIIGTGGGGNTNICPGPATSCPSQINFVKLCGFNGYMPSVPPTQGCFNDYGFTSFSVDTTAIHAKYVSVNGNFQDEYYIKTNSQDFSLTEAPVSVSRGVFGVSSSFASPGTIHINSFAGLSGTVSFSKPTVTGPTGVCPGTNCPDAAIPASVTVFSGQTVSSSLNVTTTLQTSCALSPSTAFLITLTATSGSLSRTITIPLYVNGQADINKDGVINIVDLASVAGIFGKTRGSAGWNPNMDLNNDGAINIVDLVLVAGVFGSTGGC